MMIFFWLISFVYSIEHSTNASTSALGENISAYDRIAGIHIAPALLADQTLAMQFSLSAHQFQFNNLDNIVVKNPINDNRTDSKKSDYDFNYDNVNIMDLSIQIPFLGIPRTSMGFHVSSPTQNLMMINTLDPFLPEYYSYSQYQKPNFSLYFIKKLQTLDFAFGINTGINANGKTQILAKTNGDPDGGSSGKIDFETKPNSSFLLSFAKSFDSTTTYFTYHHEQKSRFVNKAYGLTPAGGSVEYEFDLSSAIFYSPKIYRFGFEKHFQTWSLYSQLRYEDWKSFESPVLKIDKNSGVIESSEDDSQISPQSIWIGSLGAEIQHKKIITRYGLSYKPSMLKNTQNSQTNLLDADKIVSNVGIAYPFIIEQSTFYLNSSLQYTDIVKRTINKTNNREDGKAGDKIGSPGYQFDGSIIAVFIGLSWNT